MTFEQLAKEYDRAIKRVIMYEDTLLKESSGPEAAKLYSERLIYWSSVAESFRKGMLEVQTQ